MSVGKILLISRNTLQHYPEGLRPFLGVVPVQMAIVLAPEDVELAKTNLTDAVAALQHNTAIIADFVGDLVINEDGTIEPLPLVLEAPEEPKLITEA